MEVMSEGRRLGFIKALPQCCILGRDWSFANDLEMVVFFIAADYVEYAGIVDVLGDLDLRISDFEKDLFAVTVDAGDVERST